MLTLQHPHPNMTHPYQTDAVIGVNMDYRRNLKEIDEQLVSQDLKSLKFLCQDIIPASHLEDVCRGLDLIAKLESRGLIGPGNVHLLAELLYRIGRNDLVKRLGYSVRDLRFAAENNSGLSSYRILLQDICEDVTKREAEQMKFIVLDHIPRKQLDKVSDAMDLLTALERGEVIQPDDVVLLEEMVRSINRGDLAAKVRQYKGSDSNHSKSGPGYFSQQDRQNTNHGLVNLIPNRLYEGNSPCSLLGPNHAFALGDRLWQGQGQEVTKNCSNQVIHPLTGDVIMGESQRDANQASQDGRNVIPMDVPNREAGVGFTEINIRPGEAVFGPTADVVRQAELVAPPAEQQVPTMVVEAAEPEEIGSYKMDARPRGICVIINNKDFHQEDEESKKMPQREGTNVDKGNLEYIFEKLSFKVETYENLTHEEMVRTLVHYSHNVNHTMYDCFTCCILTHGLQGQLYGSNGKLLKIHDLTSSFKAVNCPSLRGKPKLFFIQACQGKEKQYGVQVEADAPYGADDVETLPNEADFLMGYATVPGFVSFRSKTHGSWFITKLVEMLDKYAEREDLLSILVKVNEEVGKAEAAIGDLVCKQIPAPQITLRKKLYFR